MINFLNIRKGLLIVVLILASFLRFWNLGSVPPSTSMDEASIGYNAYSVLKTGGDEYGKFPLISQRAYDDWRRSTYLFLTIPFVYLFGLNSIAIRLPAVILSILTVWATYHIILSLFSKRSTFSLNVALITSLLLAISPWHIYISRLGHESNACFSFFIFGMLFFLQGEKKKQWILIFVSMIFFTLSAISYYSGQAFIPLFVLWLIILFRKNLLSMIADDKKILIPFFAFMLLLIPIFSAIFSREALVRFEGTSTFKPEAHGDMFRKDVELRNKAVKNNDVVGMIIYNRHLFPVKVFFDGYISHFNPKWLFTNDSSESFKAPNMGLLYLWEAPFIFIGIFALLFNKNLSMNVKLLIFLWFFLGPLPAALATQAPHVMRSYNVLPTWQIFSAFGLVYVFYTLKKFRVFIAFIFGFFILLSLATFYKNYFIVFPREQSDSFHYVLSKAIPFTLSEQKNYQKIVFSNKDNLYQSYMLFLYYSHYDPLLYQKQGGTKSGGFAETHQFGKYEFRPIQWQNEKNGLYIGNIDDFSKGVHVAKIIKNLDGKLAIIIVEKNK